MSLALSLLIIPAPGHAQNTWRIRLRTTLRGIVQRYGPTRLKASMWNQEYASGHWAVLEEIPDDPVYPHLEEQARGGDILDLGCGPGAVGNHLNPARYRSYLGVDISEVAIAKAREKNTASGRADRNSYLAADILTFETKQKFDAILFGDSIYYFPVRRAAELLDRYCENLKPDGVYVVRMFVTSKRAQMILQHIENHFEILESHSYLDSMVKVLAFRPRIVRSLSA
jgi:SAM-dependent methyltransferase